ncbi:uncharacterized protein VTP21DRAFT_1453 [Calcarisporiella thermophila]|uniref:uncharacterized protein n=1 Tax=Calcarisporiella thermophila TaxID=911321 RepID=UPI003743FF6D
MSSHASTSSLRRILLWFYSYRMLRAAVPSTHAKFLVKPDCLAGTTPPFRPVSSENHASVLDNPRFERLRPSQGELLAAEQALIRERARRGPVVFRTWKGEKKVNIVFPKRAEGKASRIMRASLTRFYPTCPPPLPPGLTTDFRKFMPEPTQPPAMASECKGANASGGLAPSSSPSLSLPPPPAPTRARKLIPNTREPCSMAMTRTKPCFSPPFTKTMVAKGSPVSLHPMPASRPLLLVSALSSPVEMGLRLSLPVGHPAMAALGKPMRPNVPPKAYP